VPLTVVAKIAIAVAASAAQMALTASQKIEGPRLDALDANLGDYGAPLPSFWGVSRFDGTPIIFAEKLKEKKKTSKTKGGKYTQYKYYGTWAVAVADHEIDAVRGIWLDRHLCFQTGGVGPLTPILGDLTIVNGDTDSPPVKLTLGGNLRVYLGTETQEPDPRYSAWCEDRYGAPDMAPAFLGVAYVVFQDIPLEKFGNRLPQVSIEAVSAKTPSYPYEQIETGSSVGTNGAYASGGSWIIHYAGSGRPIEWFDAATRTFVGTSDWSGLDGNVTNIDLANDGTAYFLDQHDVGGNAFTALYTVSPVGTVSGFDTGAPWLVGPTRVFDLEHERYIFGGVPTDHAGWLSSGILQTDGESGCDACLHGDGDVWGLFEPLGSSDQVTLKQLTGGSGAFTFTSPVTRSNPDDGATFCHAAQFGLFFVVTDGKFILVDDTTGAVVASGNFAGSTLNLPRKNPNATSFWSGYTEISLQDGALLGAQDPNNWLVENTNGEDFFDSVNGAIWNHPQFTTHQTIRFLNRVDSDGVLLGDIVADVMQWSGVTSFDVSALDQVVKGYSVVQGTGREMIEPLLSAHFSSARPHEFTLEFIKLGAAPSGDTVLTEDFAALGNESRFSARIATDKDLPRKVTVNFADSNKDYQTNNVIAQRGLDEVSAVSERSIDLTTYIGTSDELRPLADRYFRQQWLERESILNSFTPQEIALEPGDVRNISLKSRDGEAGKVRTVRAEKVTFAAGALKIEWTRTHPSLGGLSTNPGAPMEGRDPDTIYVSGPTKGLVLDIPLVSDGHDSSLPLLYYGAGKYLAGTAWPGATIYKGDAAGTSYADFADVSSSGGMTWGIASDELGDVVSPWLWDRANSVNVNVRGGTLASVTEDEINEDPTLNLAYLGGELLNFATVVLESDGTYTLSGLKRGRRGTEWATAEHLAGEEFVLVSELARAGLGLSEVGTVEYFKAVTLGQDPLAASAISFTFAGASLKPYAPARVKARFDGADWIFTVARRTRVGGRWNGSTIPLSEASEAYEIDVYSGSTLKRTLTLTGTNSVTYTNAMQVADFGSTQTAKPPLIAYQMSDAVGRGFALAA
jgi:hypothetical protein